MGPELNDISEPAVRNGSQDLPAEHYFARMVEASPKALVLAGSSGRIEMVNRQAELTFGGLAIVKKRVQAHGGRIWVQSAPPVRGRTVVFTRKEPAA